MTKAEDRAEAAAIAPDLSGVLARPIQTADGEESQ